MKAKQGYVAQKHQSNTGNWLKRYFETRTSRKSNICPEDYQCPVCGYYCLGCDKFGCIDKPSLQEDYNKEDIL